MKLTKYQALFWSYDMWDYMAEYPVQENGGLTEKRNWIPPKESGYKIMRNGDCFLCDYDGGCCLIKWNSDKMCMDGYSEFSLWYYSKNTKTRSKYARIIADKCWNELIKLKEFKDNEEK